MSKLKREQERSKTRSLSEEKRKERMMELRRLAEKARQEKEDSRERKGLDYTA